ncbi:undecaprenyldiphospho-muramoylpentapeptide beta-N-acetylglucosaminyltransferase [Coxiella endosymbiont of Rhipicephalus microplus]|uniref:undecaprenyldiphospho-muramoylpentapeptide beta-N-acetylglucosaminyltransferase n=1 Tax=Coxiella endosymbiont of Rhipicephalus microplus TaxID=1656186 RepID=UPI000C7F7B9E|nr:undecaprenyldiphospho-muramoylpentapeptide beta-N-acetylglucosaminyltransferase [Coxiella endosymbiont of Rhipicephalus microplus]
MKRILIMAGGTGGHIFAALAVARALQQQGIEIHWLGTESGLEKKLVSPEFPLRLIQIKALRGKGLLQKFFLPFCLARAVFQSYRVIRRVKPQIILGMGGYVAGTGGLAAWLSRTPMVIHEQNAVAGLTNRVLVKIAHSVLQAFSGTFSGGRGDVKTTGNPIRAELINTPLPRIRLLNRQGPLRILVLGGSQGARSINQKIMTTLKNYPHPQELMLWHQTGQVDYERLKRAYSTLNFTAQIDGFIDDMAKAYTWADLIVCRSGALTVSEIAAVGVASIFIPYPYAVDDHQLYNGRFLEQAGAAIIIPEKLLTAKCLIFYFKQFAHDRNRLLRMAECARNLAEPKAVQNIINECKKLL